MAADPDYMFPPAGRSRPKKLNFSDREIQVLVSNVVTHQDLLCKKNVSWELRDTQNAIWQFILQEVNKVAQERRTITQIKTKWQKYQQTMKTIETVNLIDDDDDDDEDADSMPLQQRLSHSSTTSSTDNTQSQPSTSHQPPEPTTLLQSQTITPTKIKVTRQGIKSVPTPPPAPAVVDEEVCLRWNSHHTNMQAAFPNILLREKYVDTTLVSEGRQKLKCHRMILSACSQYFEDVLNDIGPLQHPVICMKDIPYWILKALCDFMYAGEVHIRQTKLEELLKVAEVLQIKGLAGKPDTKEDIKPIKQELKDPIKQEPNLAQPIVKLVKEPLHPHYSNVQKSKEPAPQLLREKTLIKEKTPVKEKILVKEKTPVKEPHLANRQKGQSVSTRSGKEGTVPTPPNTRQKDGMGWKEVFPHSKLNLPGITLRQKEKNEKQGEKEEPPAKKPGPKSKTLPSELPQKNIVLKVIPPPKPPPPSRASTSKAPVRGGRLDRGRSQTQQQKELKIPLNKDNINDPLDLLVPVHAEIQKQPPPPKASNVLAKIPLPVVAKKGPGPGRKKRKVQEEESEDGSTFPGRKGTRSRPNVKVPRFYDPGDATIVRVPHTDQPLPNPSDPSSQTDPFQSIEMEEIKVEPAEMEESILSDAGGNIVTMDVSNMDMGQPEHECEEIIGSYDSPIVNIKKEAGTTSGAFRNIRQSHLINETTVTEGRTSTGVKINKDQLKVVDISRIQSGKSNVDQLVHTPVNNPGIKISNVQTVPEETTNQQTALRTSDQSDIESQNPPVLEPISRIETVEKPMTSPETIVPSITQPEPESINPEIEHNEESILGSDPPPPILEPSPATVESQPLTTDKSNLLCKKTQEKKKKSEKKIAVNPLAVKIKEERMDPDFAPTHTDLPSLPQAESQVYIKKEPITTYDDDSYLESSDTMSHTSSTFTQPNPEEIMDIIGVTIKKEIIDDPDQCTPSVPEKQHKQFKKIKLSAPKLVKNPFKALADVSKAKVTDTSESDEININISCIKTEQLEDIVENQGVTEESTTSNLESTSPSSLKKLDNEITNSCDVNVDKTEDTAFESSRNKENILQNPQNPTSETTETSVLATDHPQESCSDSTETTVPPNDQVNKDGESSTQEMHSLEDTPKLDDHTSSNEGIDTPPDKFLSSVTEHCPATENKTAEENVITENKTLEESNNLEQQTCERLESGNTQEMLSEMSGNTQEMLSGDTHEGLSEINENLEVPSTNQEIHTQEMLSIENSQNLDDLDEKCPENVPFSDDMPNIGEDKNEEQNVDYQNYSQNQNCAPSDEIDFTKDDFGQIDYQPRNEYPEPSNYGLNTQQDVASNYEETDSAVANIPGQDYNDKNFQDYENYNPELESEGYPNVQETESAVNSLQEPYNYEPQNTYATTSGEQMDTGIDSKMDEDLMLEGAEESKKIDDSLDESLLEDFDEDIVMAEPLPSDGASEKTLEMIVNDLNESLGDPRHPDPSNPP